MAGLLSRYVLRRPGLTRLILPCAAAHVLGSMIVKPLGLFAFYGYTVLWRIPLYLVIAPLEILLICLMDRNVTVRRMLDGRGGDRRDL